MIYKQRLTAPYYQDKLKIRHSATFDLRGIPGVYQIFKNGVLRYVGFSGKDLYKAMYRHFQQWNDKTQQRVTYDPKKVKVRVIYTNTPAQAYNLEKALIIKYKPKDNPNKYYLNYDTDEKEEKIFKEFLEEKAGPVIQYKGDLPF